MVIGYQGILGSNAWYVAKKYIEDNSIEATLLPLVNSIAVVDALVMGTIDLGVMAYCNSTAGIVLETKEATKNIALECVSIITIPIHHALLAKKGYKEIHYIASHIQALKQTRLYRESHYPNAIELEVGDTALASEMLEDGTLSMDTAVISRIECSSLYHLEVIEEAIEDNKTNQTEFHVVRRISK